jgi:pilus assembly protein Flp/PilA
LSTLARLQLLKVDRERAPLCRETTMTSLIRRLTSLEDGQDLIEYAVLASLIAIAAVAAVRVLGDTVSGVLWGFISASI